MYGCYITVMYINVYGVMDQQYSMQYAASNLPVFFRVVIDRLLFSVSVCCLFFVLHIVSIARVSYNICVFMHCSALMQYVLMYSFHLLVTFTVHVCQDCTFSVLTLITWCETVVLLKLISLCIHYYRHTHVKELPNKCCVST